MDTEHLGDDAYGHHHHMGAEDTSHFENENQTPGFSIREVMMHAPDPPLGWKG